MKSITIKSGERKNSFTIPLEFNGDFSDDEKIEILKLYFQEMASALLKKKTLGEFIDIIKNILKSKGYPVMQSVSITQEIRFNIFGPLSEMMISSASQILQENPTWPPNLAASIIFCVNALEIDINNKLINKFIAAKRPDKVKLVEKDRRLSLEDKLSWLLTEAFGKSLKENNTLWNWFLDIKKMRNMIVHFKKDTDGTNMTLKNKPGKKLNNEFVIEAIENTKKIIDYLKSL